MSLDVFAWITTGIDPLDVNSSHMYALSSELRSHAQNYQQQANGINQLSAGALDSVEGDTAEAIRNYSSNLTGQVPNQVRAVYNAADGVDMFGVNGEEIWYEFYTTAAFIVADIAMIMASPWGPFLLPSRLMAGRMTLKAIVDQGKEMAGSLNGWLRMAWQGIEEGNEELIQSGLPQVITIAQGKKNKIDGEALYVSWLAGFSAGAIISGLYKGASYNQFTKDLSHTWYGGSHLEFLGELPVEMVVASLMGGAGDPLGTYISSTSIGSITKILQNWATEKRRELGFDQHGNRIPDSPDLDTAVNLPDKPLPEERGGGDRSSAEKPSPGPVEPPPVKSENPSTQPPPEKSAGPPPAYTPVPQQSPGKPDTPQGLSPEKMKSPPPAYSPSPEKGQGKSELPTRGQSPKGGQEPPPAYTPKPGQAPVAGQVAPPAYTPAPQQSPGQVEPPAAHAQQGGQEAVGGQEPPPAYTPSPEQVPVAGQEPPAPAPSGGQEAVGGHEPPSAYTPSPEQIPSAGQEPPAAHAPQGGQEQVGGQQSPVDSTQHQSDKGAPVGGEGIGEHRSPVEQQENGPGRSGETQQDSTAPPPGAPGRTPGEQQVPQQDGGATPPRSDADPSRQPGAEPLPIGSQQPLSVSQQQVSDTAPRLGTGLDGGLPGFTTSVPQSPGDVPGDQPLSPQDRPAQENGPESGARPNSTDPDAARQEPVRPAPDRLSVDQPVRDPEQDAARRIESDQHGDRPAAPRPVAEQQDQQDSGRQSTTGPVAATTGSRGETTTSTPAAPRDPAAGAVRGGTNAPNPGIRRPDQVSDATEDDVASASPQLSLEREAPQEHADPLSTASLPNVPATDPGQAEQRYQVRPQHQDDTAQPPREDSARTPAPVSAEASNRDARRDENSPPQHRIEPRTGATNPAQLVGARSSSGTAVPGTSAAIPGVVSAETFANDPAGEFAYKEKHFKNFLLVNKQNYRHDQDGLLGYRNNCVATAIQSLNADLRPARAAEFVAGPSGMVDRSRVPESGLPPMELQENGVVDVRDYAASLKRAFHVHHGDGVEADYPVGMISLGYEGTHGHSFSAHQRGDDLVLFDGQDWSLASNSAAEVWFSPLTSTDELNPVYSPLDTGDEVDQRSVPEATAMTGQAEPVPDRPDSAALVEDLNRDGVVIAVADGRSFGHQAAATTLAKSLRGLGVRGEITVVGDAEPIAKLRRLIGDDDGLRTVELGSPEWHGAGDRVVLSAADDAIGPENVEEAANFLDRFGANEAIVLKPYLWETGTRVHLSRPDPNAEPAIVDLDQRIDPNALYRFEVPRIDDPAELKRFIGDHMRGDDRIAGVHAVVDAVTGPARVDLMPIYGMRNVEPFVRPGVSAHLAEGIHASNPGRPSIMLEISDSQVGYVPRHEAPWLSYADVTDGDLSEVIAGLGPDDVLVLRTGGLPQHVFWQLFQLGDLPAAIEGANATNLAALVGRPYLSLHDGSTPYPRHDQETADRLSSVTRGLTGGTDWTAAATGQADARSASDFLDEDNDLLWAMNADTALESLGTLREYVEQNSDDADMTVGDLGHMLGLLHGRGAEVTEALGGGREAGMVGRMVDTPVATRWMFRNAELPMPLTADGLDRVMGAVRDERARVGERLRSLAPNAPRPENVQPIADAVREFRNPDSPLGRYVEQAHRSAHDPANDQVLQALHYRAGATVAPEGASRSVRSDAVVAARTADVHLGQARRDVELREFMQDAVMGRFTGHRGDGGHVTTRGARLNALRDHVRQFYGHARGLLSEEGERGPVTLYRAIRLGAAERAAGTFTDRLPSSTSFDPDMVREWTRNRGGRSQYAIFEIRTQPSHALIAMSYPPELRGRPDNAQEINADQSEVLLAPSEYIEVGRRVENGFTIISVEAQELAVEDADQLIQEQAPGMGIPEAFQAFTRFFEQESMRSAYSFDLADASATVIDRPDGRSRSFVFTRPGLQATHTFTVELDASDRRVTVWMTPSDRRAVKFTYDAGNIDLIAAYLRDGTLHDTEQFENLFLPTEWLQHPAEMPPAEPSNHGTEPSGARYGGAAPTASPQVLAESAQAEAVRTRDVLDQARDDLARTPPNTTGRPRVISLETFADDPVRRERFVRRYFAPQLRVNKANYERNVPGHRTNCAAAAINTSNSRNFPERASRGEFRARPSGVVQRGMVEVISGLGPARPRSYASVEGHVDRLPHDSHGPLFQQQQDIGHWLTVLNLHGWVVYFDGQTGDLGARTPAQALYFYEAPTDRVMAPSNLPVRQGARGPGAGGSSDGRNPRRSRGASAATGRPGTRIPTSLSRSDSTYIAPQRDPDAARATGHRQLLDPVSESVEEPAAPRPVDDLGQRIDDPVPPYEREEPPPGYEPEGPPPAYDDVVPSNSSGGEQRDRSGHGDGSTDSRQPTGRGGAAGPERGRRHLIDQQRVVEVFRPRPNDREGFAGEQGSGYQALESAVRYGRGGVESAAALTESGQQDGRLPDVVSATTFADDPVGGADFLRESVPGFGLANRQNYLDGVPGSDTNCQLAAVQGVNADHHPERAAEFTAQPSGPMFRQEVEAQTGLRFSQQPDGYSSGAEYIKGRPEGSQAIVYRDQGDGDGHFFRVKNIDGRAVFLDDQIGWFADLDTNPLEVWLAPVTSKDELHLAPTPLEIAGEPMPAGPTGRGAGLFSRRKSRPGFQGEDSRGRSLEFRRKDVDRGTLRTDDGRPNGILLEADPDRAARVQEWARTADRIRVMRTVPGQPTRATTAVAGSETDPPFDEPAILALGNGDGMFKLPVKSGGRTRTVWASGSTVAEYLVRSDRFLDLLSDSQRSGHKPELLLLTDPLHNDVLLADLTRRLAQLGYDVDVFVGNHRSSLLPGGRIAVADNRGLVRFRVRRRRETATVGTFFPRTVRKTRYVVERTALASTRYSKAELAEIERGGSARADGRPSAQPDRRDDGVVENDHDEIGSDFDVDSDPDDVSDSEFDPGSDSESESEAEDEPGGRRPGPRTEGSSAPRPQGRPEPEPQAKPKPPSPKPAARPEPPKAQSRPEPEVGSGSRSSDWVYRELGVRPGAPVHHLERALAGYRYAGSLTPERVREIESALAELSQSGAQSQPQSASKPEPEPEPKPGPGPNRPAESEPEPRTQAKPEPRSKPGSLEWVCEVLDMPPGTPVHRLERAFGRLRENPGEVGLQRIQEVEDVLTALKSGAQPSAGTQRPPRPTSQPQPNPKAEAKAKKEAEARAEAKAREDAKAKAEAKARKEAEARAEAQAKAEAKAKEDAQARAEAKARKEAEARAEAQAKADAKAREDAKAKAEAKAKEDAKARAEAQAKAEAKAKEDAKAKAEAQAKAEAKAKEDAKA
ncbi:toxin glutamine deamidase domain-containing protein, partial [Saccharopolyspora sp. NPDC002578]